MWEVEGIALPLCWSISEETYTETCEKSIARAALQWLSIVNKGTSEFSNKSLSSNHTTIFTCVPKIFPAWKGVLRKLNLFEQVRSSPSGWAFAAVTPPHLRALTIHCYFNTSEKNLRTTFPSRKPAPDCWQEAQHTQSRYSTPNNCSLITDTSHWTKSLPSPWDLLSAAGASPQEATHWGENLEWCITSVINSNTEMVFYSNRRKDRGFLLVGVSWFWNWTLTAQQESCAQHWF